MKCSLGCHRLPCGSRRKIKKKKKRMDRPVKCKHIFMHKAKIHMPIALGPGAEHRDVLRETLKEGQQSTNALHGLNF